MTLELEDGFTDTVATAPKKQMDTSFDDLDKALS